MTVIPITGPTAARMLGVSRPSLTRLRNAHILPSLTTAGHPRYDGSAVAALADLADLAEHPTFFAVRFGEPQGPDRHDEVTGWDADWDQDTKLRALSGWWPVDPATVERVGVIAGFVAGLCVGVARAPRAVATTNDGRVRTRFDVTHDTKLDRIFLNKWLRTDGGWAYAIFPAT